MNDKSCYQAYLLRLQRERAQTHWRVMLKDAQTGEKRHFADEEAFVRYLLARLQATAVAKSES